MLDRPRWGVAAIFYLLYVAGLVYFAISQGWQAGSWQTAALNGALLGFFCYLTYNATNLSVMKGYDGVVAVLDTAGGHSPVRSSLAPPWLSWDCLAELRPAKENSSIHGSLGEAEASIGLISGVMGEEPVFKAVESRFR